AAFAPFIAGVHPSFFGLDSFTELERSLDLTKIFEQVDYIKWRGLRQSEDSRFVGLTLPRILLRLPYGTPGAPRDALGLREGRAGRGPASASGGTRSTRSGPSWSAASFTRSGRPRSVASRPASIPVESRS